MDSTNRVLSELSGVLERVAPDAAARVADAVEGAARVFVFGAGRSGHIVSSFAMRLAQMGFPARVIGEATAPAPGPRDLVVGLSGTGATPSTLHLLKKAAAAGASVMGITASPDSPVARLAQEAVIVPGATKARHPGEPGSVQPLGSLFEQAAFVLLEAAALTLYERSAGDSPVEHTNME